MIEELTRKLFSTLTGNGTLVSLTQGIYLRQAPEQQSYPYVTFFPISENPIHTHTNISEDTHWQFSTFSLKASTMASIHQEIKNTLDGVTLGLNTLQQCGVLREATGPLLIEDVDEQGVVYHQPIDYRITVK